jgi:hypothetical protein
VHGVPPLVTQPALHDHDRRHDDRDEQHRADGGGDHPGVDAAAEHRRDLLGQREPVEQRVAPDAEDDVREHEVETGVAVPAMPDGQPVEADEPLEHGGPREEDHLEEREVGAEQACQTGDAREALAAAAEREIAAVDPQPDDRGRIPEHDGPDGRQPEGAAPVPPDGDRRKQRLGHGSGAVEGGHLTPI